MVGHMEQVEDIRTETLDWDALLIYTCSKDCTNSEWGMWWTLILLAFTWNTLISLPFQNILVGDHCLDPHGGKRLYILSRPRKWIELVGVLAEGLNIKKHSLSHSVFTNNSSFASASFSDVTTFLSFLFNLLLFGFSFEMSQLAINILACFLPILSWHHIWK